jgi:hypothetical protein
VTRLRSFNAAPRSVTCPAAEPLHSGDAPATAGFAWRGHSGSGRRHDRRALADFPVQIFHLIVWDDKVSVGMRFVAAVRMFLAGNANREAKRFYDHCGAGGTRDSNERQNREHEEKASASAFGHNDNPDA